MYNKKALHPVVAVALLLVVSVTAVVGFQTWFSQFSSSLFVQAEQSGDGNNIAQGINNFQNGNIYFNHKTNDNVTVTQVKIGNTTCSKNITLKKGINKIKGCFGKYSDLKDVVVYTNKGIYEDKVFEKSLDIKFICKSDSDGFHNGNGTQASPYEVCNCNQLQNVSNNLTASYKQVTNVDCSATSSWNGGNGFDPIASGSRFKGEYNGENYDISNLFINRDETDEVGLFSRTNEATLKNIVLKSINITGSSDVGGVAGYMNTGSSIDNIKVVDSTIYGDKHAIGGVSGFTRSGSSVHNSKVENVTVTSASSYGVGGVSGYIDVGVPSFKNLQVKNSELSGSYNVGGILGFMEAGYIDNSSIFNVNITSISGGNGGLLGGVVGYIREGKNITGSRVNNLIINGTGDHIGGIVGYFDDNTLVEDFRVTSMNIIGDTKVGGIIGGMGSNFDTVEIGYINAGNISASSDVGGILGGSTGTIDNTYWNNQTVQFTGSDTTDSGAGTPKNTSQLQNPQSATGIYANWSSTIWDFGTSSEYPRFKWE